ncbi:MAG: hypothetical protein KJO07_09310, partial [Deltaproteobacteria bacterium]|nr:hypothetical protein [Deltaproteobacteria bacterium]
MRALHAVFVLSLVSCGSPQQPCPKCPEPKMVSPAADAGLPDAAPDPKEQERRLVLTPVSFADLPGWKDGEQGGALVALERSCRKLSRYKGTRSVGRRTDLAGTVADWRAVCARVKQLDHKDHGKARAY